MRQDTIKFLEENIHKTLFEINCSNIVLDLSPSVMEIKIKINKWNLLKLKSFCTAKEAINKMKRQSSEWEKIIANEKIYKRIISKIYNSSCSLIPEDQTTQPRSG